MKDVFSIYDGIHIQLTATNAETEKSRIPRLWAVLGYITAQCENDHSLWVDTFEALERLHDHKGELTVSWRRVPTKLEIDWFKAAWGSPIAGELEENVVHEI